jgi:hypothetical protein
MPPYFTISPAQVFSYSKSLRLCPVSRYDFFLQSASPLESAAFPSKVKSQLSKAWVTSSANCGNKALVSFCLAQNVVAIPLLFTFKINSIVTQCSRAG